MSEYRPSDDFLEKYRAGKLYCELCDTKIDSDELITVAYDGVTEKAYCWRTDVNCYLSVKGT